MRIPSHLYTHPFAIKYAVTVQRNPSYWQLFFVLTNIYDNALKTQANLYVHTTKTQISMLFVVTMKKQRVISLPVSTEESLLSDRLNEQVSQSLRFARSSFCRFSRSLA